MVFEIRVHEEMAHDSGGSLMHGKVEQGLDKSCEKQGGGAEVRPGPTGIEIPIPWQQMQQWIHVGESE